MAKAPVLPSERDVKRLADELRHAASDLETIQYAEELAPFATHAIHAARCRMTDAAFSLDMLRKLIPARGPFDG